MGSKRDKKDKKDRKDKKDKKDRKKRRRDDTSSSSSDEDAGYDRKKAKSEKLAAKVVQHLQKAPGGTEAFVWTKKVEKELEQGKKLKEISIFADRDRQAERLEEIEKVRKRQAEREAEKARREEELSAMQRVRAMQEAMESEAKEEEFYLKALVTKAERRLRDERPEPIDLIAKNLHLTEQFGHDMVPPWTYFERLMVEDVERLCDGIKEYQEFDKYDEQHVAFWQALGVIAEHERGEARRREEVDRAHLRGDAAPPHLVERGLHPDVENDIEAMLTGQTLTQLLTLEKSVEASLASGEGDSEYWEAVLRRLKIHKAKAKIREVQASLLGAELARKAAGPLGPGAGGIAATMGWDAEDRGVVYKAPSAAAAAAIANAEEIPVEYTSSAEEEEEPARAAAGEGPSPGSRAAAAAAAAAGPGVSEEGEEEEEEVVADGRLSPAPVDPLLVAGQDVVHEEDDYRELELLRRQVAMEEAGRFQAASQLGAGTSSVSEAELSSMLRGRSAGVHPMLRNLTEAAPEFTDMSAFRSGRMAVASTSDTIDTQQLTTFRAAAQRMMGLDEGDRDFGGEVPLESQVYWWHEKYKPRKPKYFNRVHTGYEWNKYNQTHYDSDNPPPKVVQGYKFNILYHDLIDKSKAPTYVVERDPLSQDDSTCILRFIAGPPYEDIAFRIVRKDWEYSHKKGFKCTFERGILHLYFNFKRARYRR